MTQIIVDLVNKLVAERAARKEMFCNVDDILKQLKIQKQNITFSDHENKNIQVPAHRP